MLLFDVFQVHAASTVSAAKRRVALFHSTARRPYNFTSNLNFANHLSEKKARVFFFSTKFGIILRHFFCLFISIHFSNDNFAALLV